MQTTARRQLNPALIDLKPLPPLPETPVAGEPLGARAVRLARAAAAMHMAEVARVRLNPDAVPSWGPPACGVCSPLAEGAD